MRPARLLRSGLALLITGCSQGSNSTEKAETTVVLPTPSHTEAGVITPVDGPSPVLATPAALTAEAERGEKGARDVLLSFAGAVERKEFDSAWAMLSPADRKKWSRSEFAAQFAGIDTITVAIPGGSLEGTAGSSYYTAPVTVTGDVKGSPRALAGEAVLRRVNDVDGSSAANRRWHFETLTLQPTKR